MFTSRLRAALVPTGIVALVLTAAPALADDAKIPLPQTVAEHQARAQKYLDQAAAYRKEANEHKEMAAEYAAKRPKMKGSPQRPDVMKMSKHCEALAKDYEKLAVDSEKAADYHKMRAQEMEGG